MKESIELLNHALIGLEEQRKRIDAAIAEIEDRLRGRSEPVKRGPKTERGRMSAAGRERIRQAQIARWKKLKRAAKAA